MLLFIGIYIIAMVLNSNRTEIEIEIEQRNVQGLNVFLLLGRTIRYVNIRRDYFNTCQF